MWTVQEFALAQKRTVMCGRHTIPWNLFYSRPRYATAALQQRRISQEWNQIAYNLRMELDSRFSLLAFPNVFALATLPGPIEFRWVLANLVSMTRGNNCTDLRDKAYELYGILSAYGVELPVVDYSKDVVEIYQEFVIFTMQSTNSFWVPSLARASCTIPRFPSWVPESSVYDVGATIQQWRPLSRDLEIESTQNSTIHSDTFSSSQPGTIALQGRRLASILLIDERWPPLSRLFGDTLNMEIVAQSLAQMTEVLSSWISFAARDGRGIDGIGTLALITFQSELDYTTKARKSFMNLVAWHQSIERHKPSETQFLAESNQWTRFIGPMNIASAGSVLFSTSEGQLGSTFGWVEPSDVLVLLAGSDWPVILRSVGQNYQYIGPVFVPGIMKGEAWPSDIRVEDTETFVLI